MDEKYEYVTILFEKMQGDIKQVLEGHQVLHNEITRTREELREEIQLNTIRIDAVNESLGKRIDASNESLSNRIDAVDEKLSNRIDSVEESLSKRIDAVDEKLSNRIDAVDEKLSNRIDAVEENLGNRIDSVEENLGSHIDAVAVDLKAHRADTEAHHGIYRVKENGLCFSFSPFFSLTNV